MKKTIRLLSSRINSKFMHEYGFAVYGSDERMQGLFRKIYNGGAGELQLEFEIPAGEDPADVTAASSVDLYIDGVRVENLDEGDRQFLKEKGPLIGLAEVSCAKLPHDDEHYTKSGLRKKSELDVYYMIVNLYYFDEVLSEKRREEIMENEINLLNKETGPKKKRFKERDIRLIFVLNIILVAACIALAVYCYIHDLKKYGIFMVLFAFFFAAWGRKFRRSGK